jgi:RHS repeat-associated protein
MDAAGKTISTTDNGGQLNYSYDSWGNQRNVAFGSYNLVKTTYDLYGRANVTTNINAGSTTDEYNAYGELASTKNALGHTTTMVYDGLGRTITRTGAEGITSYTYFNEAGTGYSNNEPVSVTSFNGTNETYTYDNLRRVKTSSRIIDGVTYTYQYEYDAYGNQSKITYPSGIVVDLVYDKNGHVTSVTNGQFGTLFTGQSMNSLGIYTGYTLGNGKVTTLTYDIPTKLPKRFYTPGVMDMNWVFDASTGNISSRKDALLNLTEAFTYDNLNRLLTTKVNNVQQIATTYDNSGGLSMGNIKTKTDAGNYVYNDQKIHALAYVTNPAGAQTPPSVIPVAQQDLTYTQYLKTSTVSENNNLLTFTYGADYQRAKSEMKVGSVLGERRIYFDLYEKRIDPNGDVEEIHYIPGGNDYFATIVRKNGTSKVCYLYPDFQGSILAATDNTGVVVAQQNFDAWGRRRNPANWQYAGVPTVPTWLIRGYTGQEHHNAFGLINLNGRMYDPLVGRMMSPDKYVPLPWNTQGYNGYAYGNNNPLVYIDKDGDIWHIVIGAAVGGLVNLGVKAFQGKINSWGDGFAAFGIGAVAGAVGAGTGGAAFAAMGGAAGGAGGFAAGAVGGAVGTALSSPIQSLGNAAYFGDPMMTGKEWLTGIGIGALTGGAINGTIAGFNGRNFWNGNLPKIDIQPVPIVAPSPLSSPSEQGRVALNGPGNSSATSQINTVKSIDYKAVYEKLASHAFSKDHLSKGIMNLGSGSRLGIMDVAVKVIETNRILLVEGSNEIIVNGGQFTVRCFAQNGQVVGANIFMGTSPRSLGNVINFYTRW